MSERATTHTGRQLQTAASPASDVLQRKCACGNHTIAGGECEECGKPHAYGMQPKLAISQPGDVYEQEADRLADQVTGMSEATAQRSLISTASVAQCKSTKGTAMDASSVVQDALSSSGQPLDRNTRSFFEPRFGYDFSQVRAHTDAKAAESAKAVNALAYTIGNHVVFGAGQYSPTTPAGKHLLAHELAHTIQQGGSVAVGARPRSVIARSPLQIARQFPLDIPNPFRGLPNPFDIPVPDIPLPSLPDIPIPNPLNIPWPFPNPFDIPQPDVPKCLPAPGILSSVCSTYASNSWWLPLAYVNNATCACKETPNMPLNYSCIRAFLQARLLSTPSSVKSRAATMKSLEITNYPAYQAYAQSELTPIIYKDHVDAYKSCCCPGGPAPYPAWIGVTTVPLACPAVGTSIRLFGSCRGIPGQW